MKFFVIRILFSDGLWSPPWSLFAVNYVHALALFGAEVGLEDADEVAMRERPIGDAAVFYGRDEVGGGSMQHPGIEWQTV